MIGVCRYVHRTMYIQPPPLRYHANSEGGSLYHEHKGDAMGILFLVSAVPSEIAGPIGGAAAVAIAALWKRCMGLEDRSQANLRESLNAMHDATDAARAAVQSIDRLADRVSSMEKKHP